MGREALGPTWLPPWFIQKAFPAIGLLAAGASLYADSPLIVALGFSIALISFASSILSSVGEHREELQRLEEALHERTDEVRELIGMARDVTAHLGDALPAETSAQLAATRDLVLSYRDAHAGGTVPVLDEFTASLCFAGLDDATAAELDGRLASLSVTWGVCSYQVQYTAAMATVSPERLAALLPPSVVTVDATFAALIDIGLTQWEPYFPLRDEVWTLASDEDKVALRKLNWLTSGSDARAHAKDRLQNDSVGLSGQPSTHLTIRNGGPPFSLDIPYLKQELSDEPNETRATLGRLDPSAERLPTSAIDKILQIYLPDPGKLRAVEARFDQRDPIQVDVTSAQTYLFPLAVRPAGRAADECRDLAIELDRFVYPLTRICKAGELTLTRSHSFPRLFRHSLPPDLPLRVRMQPGVPSVSVRDYSEDVWAIQLGGRHLYPMESIVAYWSSPPAEGSP